MRLAAIAGIVVLLLAVGCSRQKDAAAATTPDAESQTSASASVPASSDPVTPPAFDSSRAMQYVKEIVAFGPRPIGSVNHIKVEKYILSQIKGDNVERDNFEIDASEGHFPIHNISAKFPGAKDGIIVIAS